MMISFFKPINIAGEEFWDGGLAFPSPIELATWEASRIWTEDTVNDVTISLGTGEVTKSPPIDSGRSHSLQRLWSSFMDFLDGHSRSRDMKNGLCQRQREDFFRLDTQLPSPIRLDDTKSLELQKRMVYSTPQRQLTEVATALLVSSFFFKLDGPLTYEGGFYHCRGSIRCRVNARDVIRALQNIHSTQMEFVTSSAKLVDCDMERDVCSTCCRYKKAIAFYLRHPDELVTVSMRMGDTERKISGFPQTISWFEKQQGYHCPFGSGQYFQTTMECSSCTRGNKRRLSGDLHFDGRKRTRR